MTRNRVSYSAIVRTCSNVLADVGTYLAVGIGFLIVYDIVMRLAFGMPFVGTTDLVAISLLIVTFTQAPKALLLGKFLEVTVLTDHLPIRVRSLMSFSGNMLGGILFIGLALTSLPAISQAIALKEFFGSDAYRIPAAPIRVGITVTWVVFAMCFVLVALNALKGDSHD